MTEYVLVPREPTPEMLRAYWDAGMRDHDNDGTVRLTWAAMLAAAPVRATGGELREELLEIADRFDGFGRMSNPTADILREAAAALNPAIAPAGVDDAMKRRAGIYAVQARLPITAEQMDGLLAAALPLAAPQDGEAARG